MLQKKAPNALKSLDAELKSAPACGHPGGTPNKSGSTKGRASRRRLLMLCGAGEWRGATRTEVCGSYSGKERRGNFPGCNALITLDQRK
jgi:hypothetical protein